MPPKKITLELTVTEAAHVTEAVRLGQQEHIEGIGRLNPILTRVQKKLGEEEGHA